MTIIKNEPGGLLREPTYLAPDYTVDQNHIEQSDEDALKQLRYINAARRDKYVKDWFPARIKREMDDQEKNLQRYRQEIEKQKQECEKKRLPTSSNVSNGGGVSSSSKKPPSGSQARASPYPRNASSYLPQNMVSHRQQPKSSLYGATPPSVYIKQESLSPITAADSVSGSGSASYAQLYQHQVQQQQQSLLGLSSGIAGSGAHSASLMSDSYAYTLQQMANMHRNVLPQTSLYGQSDYGAATSTPLPPHYRNSFNGTNKALDGNFMVASADTSNGLPAPGAYGNSVHLASQTLVIPQQQTSQHQQEYNQGAFMSHAYSSTGYATPTSTSAWNTHAWNTTVPSISGIKTEQPKLGKGRLLTTQSEVANCPNNPTNFASPGVFPAQGSVQNGDGKRNIDTVKREQYANPYWPTQQGDQTSIYNGRFC